MADTFQELRKVCTVLEQRYAAAAVKKGHGFRSRVSSCCPLRKELSQRRDSAIRRIILFTGVSLDRSFSLEPVSPGKWHAVPVFPRLFLIPQRTAVDKKKKARDPLGSPAVRSDGYFFTSSKSASTTSSSFAPPPACAPAPGSEPAPGCGPWPDC